MGYFTQQSFSWNHFFIVCQMFNVPFCMALFTHGWTWHCLLLLFLQLYFVLGYKAIIYMYHCTQGIKCYACDSAVIQLLLSSFHNSWYSLWTKLPAASQRKSGCTHYLLGRASFNDFLWFWRPVITANESSEEANAFFYFTLQCVIISLFCTGTCCWKLNHHICTFSSLLF